MTPESVAGFNHENGYSEMGFAKPISTEWVSTGEKRTVDGGVQWEHLCRFCGENVWVYWGTKPEPHVCTELASHFDEPSLTGHPVKSDEPPSPQPV